MAEIVLPQEKRFLTDVQANRRLGFDATRLVGTGMPRLLGRFYPDLLWRVPTRRRVAYLTFDDGPTSELSGHLLDLLDRYGAKATFFLIGQRAERDAALVRATAEAGHTVGNHTYTHPDAWRAPRGQVLRELEQTTTLLEEQTQTAVRWMRPPYGRFTQAMRSWCLARRQRLTMWDVMPGDFLPRATSAVVHRRILADVRPGSIVVLHDNPTAAPNTPAALADLLLDLTADGWSLEAL